LANHFILSATLNGNLIRVWTRSHKRRKYSACLLDFSRRSEQIRARTWFFHSRLTLRGDLNARIRRPRKVKGSIQIDRDLHAMRLILLPKYIQTASWCQHKLFRTSTHMVSLNAFIYWLTLAQHRVFAFSLWQRAKNEITESTLVERQSDDDAALAPCW